MSSAATMLYRATGASTLLATVTPSVHEPLGRGDPSETREGYRTLLYESVATFTR
ncbi:hypothetical protein BN903_39 [Halorubrum sp. AJ67]|nr:hypothetical protein BN903_39 [Halorubrum sp. AJ67]